ncbi:MAG: von Willebrand factor type A domain-containing protein [Anaerolineae bacterium]|nr:von Willebrand factor type A domain-containing protein [Anaerolineae bacterium]
MTHGDRATLAGLTLTAILVAGCGALAAPGSPPAAPELYVLQEAPAAATWPTPAPTATTAGEPFAPSTGGTDEPNDQPYGDMFFEDYGVNPRIDTEDDHLSTFAVDVDTGSYTVMRRYISDGYLPPDESVRVEEYINFFDQAYAPPKEGAFAIHIDGAPSPYAENYHLVRVGLQGYELLPEDRPDVVLTFVVDVSGSMDREDRLGLVKDSLDLLIDELRPTDQIAIVVYGTNAHTLLRHTPVSEAGTIRRALHMLTPEGATNAEEGLVLAYRLASQAFDPTAINRVVLCSDGVANVGRTGPESIMSQIEEAAEEGIYMTTVGVGMGNYNDVLMEQLADRGDGFYAYVDDIREAERLFVHQLPSTLQVIARDAKVQVDFNPEVVSRYRLIGYENRDVADEDFRNDQVDAGEIGMGHSVTALYEVKLHSGVPARVAEANVSDAEKPSGKSAALRQINNILTVRLRWEDPASRQVTEIERVLTREELADRFEAAAPQYQLTVTVAQYAEILRGSYWAKAAGTTLDDIAAEADRIATSMPRDGDAQEFATLAHRATSLSATE